MVLHEGDPVKIIAGKYKYKRNGTFKRQTGRLKADVAVDGDDRAERCLFLTSIKKDTTIKTEKQQQQQQAQEEDASISVSRLQFERLVLELETLEKSMRQLKVAVDEIRNKNK
jgi:hypothetical protein